MKNPRFHGENGDPEFEMPDASKIACRNCMLREKDRNKVNGSTLAMCAAYGIKPPQILFDNEECPYYIPDGDSE